MKKIFIFLFIIASAAGSFLYAGTQVYCNPLNINYRFCLDQPSHRETADLTVVLSKDNYYLFASKSGGYWYYGFNKNKSVARTNLRYATEQ